LGFHESSKTWKERGFVPVVQHRPNDLGEHGANDLKLELHERICERLPWRLTDVSDRVFPRIPQPGLNTYATRAALMTHLLLHAAGSIASQSLRLLQLHDIAVLSARMSELDWHEVTASSRRGAGLWWAFPPLQMCARYYASHIPSRVLTGLAEACPYWLAKTSRGKSLYDVSYSYLWVDAFPGMEWSRSMREVFDYALSRVRPGEVHLAARGRIARSEVWSHHSRWPQMSQGRRIVHWITSRPTRPLTMHAVRSALAQSP
jgi:hypothetical protein